MNTMSAKATHRLNGNHPEGGGKKETSGTFRATQQDEEDCNYCKFKLEQDVDGFQMSFEEYEDLSGMGAGGSYDGVTELMQDGRMLTPSERLGLTLGSFESK
jgi:hypothetical protein